MAYDGGISSVLNNKLTDMFYYVDVSDIKSDTLIEEINTTLNLSYLKVDSLPAIIYYRSNNPINIIIRLERIHVILIAFSGEF